MSFVEGLGDGSHAAFERERGKWRSWGERVDCGIDGLRDFSAILLFCFRIFTIFYVNRFRLLHFTFQFGFVPHKSLLPSVFISLSSSQIMCSFFHRIVTSKSGVGLFRDFVSSLHMVSCSDRLCTHHRRLRLHEGLGKSQNQ